MSEAEFGIAISILIVVAAFVAWSYAVPLRRERRKTQRYPLFACRHHIVMLVAEGKIGEEDEVFQFLYESVNYLIPQSHHLSRLDIVRAAIASPIGKLANEDFRERFLGMLNHDDPEVRMVARAFFEALATKLAKIWSVKIAFFLIARGMEALARSFDWLSKLFGASPREGAELITTLENTNAGLAAAA